MTAGPEILPAATTRPLPRTPARTPGSVRRASHIGVHWPADATDTSTSELLVHGAVRDIATDASGRGRTLGEAVLDCVAAPDRTVTAMTTSPDEPALQSLVGRAARSGWRAAARDVVGADSLLGTVLDDVPIAVMLSSYGALRQGALRLPAVQPLMLNMRNLCAGWAEDATPMRLIDGGAPMPLPGVVAVPDEGETDALAHEPRRPLVPGEVRRTRRLDVTPGRQVRVGAGFRDTWCDASGTVGVLHEYELTAVLDDGVVASISAEPRVLPYDECSLAATSPARLVGRRIDDLAEEVRATAGRTTCTHLDDLLRSLVAVPSLLRAFDRGSATAGDGADADW